MAAFRAITHGRRDAADQRDRCVMSFIVYPVIVLATAAALQLISPNRTSAASLISMERLLQQGQMKFWSDLVQFVSDEAPLVEQLVGAHGTPHRKSTLSLLKRNSSKPLGPLDFNLAPLTKMLAQTMAGNADALDDPEMQAHKISSVKQRGRQNAAFGNTAGTPAGPARSTKLPRTPRTEYEKLWGMVVDSCRPFKQSLAETVRGIENATLPMGLVIHLGEHADQLSQIAQACAIQGCSNFQEKIRSWHSRQRARNSLLRSMATVGRQFVAPENIMAEIEQAIEDWDHLPISLLSMLDPDMLAHRPPQLQGLMISSETVSMMTWLVLAQVWSRPCADHLLTMHRPCADCVLTLLALTQASPLFTHAVQNVTGALTVRSVQSFFNFGHALQQISRIV